MACLLKPIFDAFVGGKHLFGIELWRGLLSQMCSCRLSYYFLGRLESTFKHSRYIVMCSFTVRHSCHIIARLRQIYCVHGSLGNFLQMCYKSNNIFRVKHVIVCGISTGNSIPFQSGMMSPNAFQFQVVAPWQQGHFRKISLSLFHRDSSEAERFWQVQSEEAWYCNQPLEGCEWLFKIVL